MTSRKRPITVIAESVPGKPISLKDLSARLGLSQATVSMALSPSADSNGIARATMERVRKAAAHYGYRPNYFAKSLSMKRSYTIAVLVPEISEGYYSSIISGIEEEVTLYDYYYLVSSHRQKKEMLETLPDVFIRRGAEGIIIVNTEFDTPLAIPVIAIGSDRRAQGITNIRLDEREGTRLALEHLASLGHRRIAYFRGDPESTATKDRWHGVEQASSELGLEIVPDLVLQLRSRMGHPKPTDMTEGYESAKTLFSRGTAFTALFAYNDVSAIGAMRAIQDQGLRVPEDISVIGYDDIPAARFERPPLTTIRQPLDDMGRRAASVLLARINDPKLPAEEMLIEPSLVLRNSTGPSKFSEASGRKSRKASTVRKPSRQTTQDRRA